MKIKKFLNSSPIFAIGLTYEKIFNPFQRELKKEGLTFIQSMILTSIYFEQRPVAPSSLASTLKTSPSNISHALKHLEKNRWIRRKHHDDDARRVAVELTNNGKKKVLLLIKTYDRLQGIFEKSMKEKSIQLWNTKANRLAEIYASQFQ